MIKKLVKLIIRLISLVFIIVIVDAILIATLPINLFKHEPSSKSYASWMEETIKSDTKLIDIKMLGAHDAFSSKITLSSKPDKALAKSGETAAKMATSNTSILYKGLLVRLMKAQNSNATTLLNKGVRYLDVRLTYNIDVGSWYTSHTFLSDDALTALSEVSTFLDTNKGEIVILDLQHIYDERTDNGLADANSYTEVKQLLVDAKLYEKAVDFSTTSLKDMTYELALQGSTSGKVVIISKDPNSDNKILNYSNSIRSSWANTIFDDVLIDYIASEVDTVKNDATLLDKFRVMQAQKTAQLSPVKAIYKTLMSWSLLSVARQSNNYVLSNDKIDEYLDVLPIFMVDYSDSNYNGFNDKVMDKIISLNS
jgi:hypothetical protein